MPTGASARDELRLPPGPAGAVTRSTPTSMPVCSCWPSSRSPPSRLAFPQITRMVTGLEPDSRRFARVRVHRAARNGRPGHRRHGTRGLRPARVDAICGLCAEHEVRQRARREPGDGRGDGCERQVQLGVHRARAAERARDRHRRRADLDGRAAPGHRVRVQPLVRGRSLLLGRDGMPWMFAGRRCVAARELQALRYPGRLAHRAARSTRDATCTCTGSRQATSKTTCVGRVATNQPCCAGRTASTSSAPTCTRRSRTTRDRGPRRERAARLPRARPSVPRRRDRGGRRRRGQRSRRARRVATRASTCRGCSKPHSPIAPDAVVRAASAARRQAGRRGRHTRTRTAHHASVSSSTWIPEEWVDAWSGLGDAVGAGGLGKVELPPHSSDDCRARQLRRRIAVAPNEWREDPRHRPGGPDRVPARPRTSRRDNEVWGIARFSDAGGTRRRSRRWASRTRRSTSATGDFGDLPDDFTYVLHLAACHRRRASTTTRRCGSTPRAPACCSRTAARPRPRW